MKTWVITLFLTAMGLAQAQEVGQVISRTAVFQRVAVPHQTCSPSPVVVENPSSGAGALMGAVAGAVVGHQMGGGSGRALATMVGGMGGAIVGDRIESPGNTVQNQTTCTTVNAYENRLTGYQVVYEYAGKQYNVQLPQDPGSTIELKVSPLNTTRSEAAADNMASAAPATPAPATIVHESRVVYVPTPVYRIHPPIYTHIHLGWGGRRGHGHPRGHWR